MSQSFNHQANHRYIDERFASRGQAFVIFAQASLAIQPREGPLYDPAFGQHLKASLVTELLDDLQRPAQVVLDPVDQLAPIAAIGPDQFQATPARILRVLD